MTEDLKLKVVSKERELWENIKKRSEAQVLQSNAEIEINETIVKLAEDKCKSIS